MGIHRDNAAWPRRKPPPRTEDAGLAASESRLVVKRADLWRIWAISLAVVACTHVSPRSDRDRGLAETPVAQGIETEPVRGDLRAGVQAYEDQDYDGAQAALQAHLQQHPRSAAAVYELGLVAMAKGQWELARQHFEKALVLNPQMHGALSNQGVALLHLGEDLAALRAMEGALALAPDDPRVLGNLAMARLRRGLWSEAIDAYQRAISLAPSHGTLLYDLALAWMIRQQWPQALTALESALQVRPQFALARAAKVACLQGIGDLKAAEVYARESLDVLQEPLPDNQLVLGRVLIAQRRVDDGLAVLRDAVKLDPLHAPSQLALAEVLDAAGKRSQAIEWYQKWLENKNHRLEDVERITARVTKLQELGPQ